MSKSGLEMSQIHSKTMIEEDGHYLTSRTDYTESINKLSEDRQLEFVNDDWRFE